MLLGPPSKAYSKKLGWIPRTGVRRLNEVPPDSRMRVAPRRQTLLLGPPSKTYSKKLGWLLRTGVRRFATFLNECLVLFLLVLLKTCFWCANKTIFAPEYFCGAAPSWRRLHFFRKIKMLYYKNTNFRPRSLPRDSKMVKINPQRPPGDPQMAKMESQRAPKDAHDHPKDPPRAPKAST